MILQCLIKHPAVFNDDRFVVDGMCEKCRGCLIRHLLFIREKFDQFVGWIFSQQVGS